MFEKEAEEYGLENYRSYDDYPYVLTDEKAITKAFKDGAEFGYNKAKEELEAQIEKMKCCSNCKNCRRKFIKKNVFEHTCKVEHCKNYDKWEIKENDRRKDLLQLRK